MSDEAVLAVNPPPPPGETLVGDLNAAGLGDKARAAAHLVQTEARNAADAKRLAKAAGRPKLTHRNVVEYLDWITVQVAGENMGDREAAIHMKAAELVISIKHSEAQGKATEHSDGTPITA